jgi:AcrR family transcriptional regulator
MIQLIENKGTNLRNARDLQATVEHGAAVGDRTPRTERGRRTLRAILDAAATEFGMSGFHETSIVAITTRAGVALGSFYTYFESKDALFRALVQDMSAQVVRVGAEAGRDAPDPLARESAITASFIAFARAHKELYRIIDESEFVDPAGYRTHYEATAARIAARLRAGAANGALRDGIGEAEAWALMGMNVFLGLRYGVWGDSEDLDAIASQVGALLGRGLAR